MNKAHKSLIWMVVATSVMWTACGKDDSKRRTNKPKPGTPEQYKIDRSEGVANSSLQGVWLREYIKSNDVEKYVVWNIKLNGEKVQLMTLLTCKKGTAKNTAKEDVSGKVDASNVSFAIQAPLKITAKANKDFKDDCSASENQDKYTFSIGNLWTLKKNDREIGKPLCKLEKKGDKWVNIDSNCPWKVELDLEIEGALTQTTPPATPEATADKTAAEKAAAEKAAAEKTEKEKNAAAEKEKTDKSAADKAAVEKAEKDKKAAEDKKRQEEEERRRATQQRPGTTPAPFQSSGSKPTTTTAAPAAPAPAASTPVATPIVQAAATMDETLLGIEFVLDGGKAQKESDKIQYSLGLVVGEDNLTFIKVCAITTDKGVVNPPKTVVNLPAKITDKVIEILETKTAGTDCKLEIEKSSMSYKFDGASRLAISSFGKDKKVVIQNFSATDGQ